MFPKKQRITKKESFDLLYKKGIIFNSDYLKIIFIPNNLDYSRFAVTVSKKVSAKATERNLIRRRLHHALQLFQKNIIQRVDLLAITQKGAENLKKDLLKEKFEMLANKINHHLNN